MGLLLAVGIALGDAMPAQLAGYLSFAFSVAAGVFALTASHDAQLRGPLNALAGALLVASTACFVEGIFPTGGSTALLCLLVALAIVLTLAGWHTIFLKTRLLLHDSTARDIVVSISFVLLVGAWVAVAIFGARVMMR